MVLHSSSCLSQHGRHPWWLFFSSRILRSINSFCLQNTPRIWLCPVTSIKIHPIFPRSLQKLSVCVLYPHLVSSPQWTFETLVNLYQSSCQNILMVFDHRTKPKVQAMVSKAWCVWIFFLPQKPESGPTIPYFVHSAQPFKPHLCASPWGTISRTLLFPWSGMSFFTQLTFLLKVFLSISLQSGCLCSHHINNFLPPATR